MIKTPLKTFVYQVIEKKVSDADIDSYFQENELPKAPQKTGELKNILHGALHLEYPVEDVLSWLAAFYEREELATSFDIQQVHDTLTRVGSGQVALIDALDLVEQISDKKVANLLKLFIYENAEGKLSENESDRLWDNCHLTEELRKITD